MNASYMQQIIDLIEPLTPELQLDARARAGATFRELGITSLQVVEVLVSLETQLGLDLLTVDLADEAIKSPRTLAHALESL